MPHSRLVYSKFRFFTDIVLCSLEFESEQLGLEEMQLATNRKSINFKHLAAVIGLLLFQFAVRSYNIMAQDAYMDEGYHIRQGVRAWQFAENPGRFAHGKLGLYYWLGLFHGPSHLSALQGSRLSIALFSLIS